MGKKIFNIGWILRKDTVGDDPERMLRVEPKA